MNHWTILINKAVLKTYTEHPVETITYSLTSEEKGEMPILYFKGFLTNLESRQICLREKRGKQVSKNDVNHKKLL